MECSRSLAAIIYKMEYIMFLIVYYATQQELAYQKLKIRPALREYKCSWFTSCSSVSEDVAEIKDIGIIKELLCSNCKIGIGVCVNGTWKSLEDILTDNEGKDGWIKVCEPQDEIVHLVLSQIVYKKHEMPKEEYLEANFDLPDPTDLVMIRWLQGRAIGFYTVKPKGTYITETRESYAMHVLDTAYISQEHRRKGFGMEILQSLSSNYPNQDVGFSKPVSFSMIQVLKRYLQQQVGDRNRFWEVDGAAGEGDRTLIWYNIKRQERKKQQQ